MTICDSARDIGPQVPGGVGESGDDENVASRILLQEREGVRAARRGCHYIAELGKDFLSHLHKSSFVIHEEDALGPVGDCDLKDMTGWFKGNG
jgi:hypothetical protein